jgi:uncharacterized protein YndB with AHSA1/START domain
MLNNNETQIKAEPGVQELFITREFNAPRELVFKAFNDPDLLVQWLGPNGLSMKIDKFSSEAGTAWRFIHADGNGMEYGFNGVNHEITAPERIVRTFEFEGLPERGHVSLECLTFEILPGNRTKIVIQSIFRSVADRDGMVQSGMERGVVNSYNRLDKVLNGMLK